MSNSQDKHDPPESNGSSQAEFERRAQSLLQASAEQLDGRTRSRLTQARYAALEAGQSLQSNQIRQSNKLPYSKPWYWLMPAGAAAAAVVAVIVATNPQQSAEEIVALTPVDELDILTAEDSLEFYRDVEFYAWLDTVLDEDSAQESGV